MFGTQSVTGGDLISSSVLIVGPSQHSCLEDNAISATQLSRYHPLIVRTAVVLWMTGLEENGFSYHQNGGGIALIG
jgi:hypothetical protein